MKLYLVQHGKARTKEDDPYRSLNVQGVEETEIVAEAEAEKGNIQIDDIYYSEKLRAKETAEIIERVLKPTNSIHEKQDLKPNDDPKKWYDILNKREHNLMIVGHMPHLSKLASLLLTGSPDNEPVQFVNSGIACLEKNGDTWIFCDMIKP